MSNVKRRSFGGATINNVSPPVPLGKGITGRKEAQMYNLNISYDGVLRMIQAGQNAANYLSGFKENMREHKQGVNLVVNFETGRVEFLSISRRG